MTDLLTVIIASGWAVAYLIETLDQFLYEWVAKTELKRILTPLAVLGANWLMGIQDWLLVVTGAASALACLLTLQWIDRPSVSLKLPTNFRGQL